MSFKPNLGPKARIGYALFGAGLAAVALLGFLPPAWFWVAVVAGAVVFLEGAAGF